MARITPPASPGASAAYQSPFGPVLFSGWDDGDAAYVSVIGPITLAAGTLIKPPLPDAADDSGAKLFTTAPSSITDQPGAPEAQVNQSSLDGDSDLLYPAGTYWLRVFTYPTTYVDDESVPVPDGNGYLAASLAAPYTAASAPSLGVPVVRAFPFDYNTSGLLTGLEVYTPTAGDLLLDAWFEITQAWDGTTPMGDLGTFDGVSYGYYGGYNAPVDMAQQDEEAASPGLLKHGSGSAGSAFPLSMMGALFSDGSGVGMGRFLPGRFTGTDPIKVVVSQDGNNNGADPGSTVGSAVLYLVTVTPATA